MEVEDESPRSSKRTMVIITPSSNSASSTPSLDEEDEEEEEEIDDDGFDDESDMFSFYNFSKRHFQNNVDHKHTPQRLKQPLLHHEDEADALVGGSSEKRGHACLIILSIST